MQSAFIADRKTRNGQTRLSGLHDSACARRTVRLDWKQKRKHRYSLHRLQLIKRVLRIMEGCKFFQHSAAFVFQISTRRCPACIQRITHAIPHSVISLSSRTTLRVISGTRTCGPPRVCYIRGHPCIRECVPYVPRERKRDTSSGVRRGKERGGRIDIKIVTEFRRAATYPNALDSPLNYPLSSRILLALPSPPSPLPLPSYLPSLHETAFPFYAPFPTLLRDVRALRYRSRKLFLPAGGKENTVVNRRSKFPAMAQKLAEG